MNKPRWLDDEPEIQQLLHWFIDRLNNKKQHERKSLLSRPINNKNFPALFRNNEHSDHEWLMIKSLQEDHNLIEIKSTRKLKPHENEFANKSLVFNPQSEQLVREWLKRPEKIPYNQQWANTVSKYAHHFSDQGEALARRSARLNGKNAEQIVAGFATLAQFIDKGLSLRQLSARCFWGHSKFLDNREDLLNALFKNVNIRPRPIMVNVCLPEKIKGVLFIENQDSYLNAVSENKDTLHTRNYDHLALIYLSGFQGSAKRIRHRAGVSLHFHATSKQDEKATFENWWFELMDQDWPSFFWGDLDFSGMSILKILRHRFRHTTAWQPGYTTMLKKINTGLGHHPQLANKEEQLDPGQTGCSYADNVLLPTLRQTTLFVDQEWD